MSSRSSICWLAMSMMADEIHEDVHQFFDKLNLLTGQF